MSEHPADIEAARERRAVPIRLLPSSDIAEKGAVCSFILAPVEIYALCKERGVLPSHFHSPALGMIFHRLCALCEQPAPVDVIALTQRLADEGVLETVGGAAFIAELYTYLPTATNAAFYLAIMEEKRLLRALITLCDRFQNRAYEEQDAAPELMEAFEKAALAIRPKPKTLRSYSGADIERLAIDALSAKMDRPAEVSGLSTGFASLDAKSDGLHETELIVIAARPQEGKSSLAFQICEYLSLDRGIPTAAFTLEMGVELLSERIVASRARVNASLWREGVLATQSDVEAIQEAGAAFRGSALRIEELSDATVQQLRLAARRLVSEFGVRLIVVDSLSKLRSDSRQGRDNREREVSEAVSGLKEMAKELKIPVVAIVHLHRRVDEKAQKGMRPGLADLRESGAIEQDADTVWILYRDEEGMSQLHGAKQRGNGGHGWTIPLEFLPQFTRFREPIQEPRQPALLDVPADKKTRRKTQHPDD